VRILVASDFYRPFIGGAEHQVGLLAAGLADRGHDVTVATVWHDGLPEREREGAVEILRIRSRLLERRWFSSDPRRRFHPPFPEPWISRRLRRLVASGGYDVVHANGWIAYSCAAALVGTRVPLVISVRDYGYACAVRNLMYRQREICSGPAVRKCLSCAGGHYGPAKGTAAVAGVFAGRPLLRRTVRAIHVVSRFVGEMVERDLTHGQDGGWRAPVVRIPDIAPLASGGSPTAQPASAATLPDEPFILFVGQLQRQKGLQVLLEAYGRLTTPPPLVLIGTVWPDTPASFPAGVTVIREAPHADVLAAWDRCLFGVTPSIWPDPLPGVVREAMSRGKPVIGSAVGGIVDMIEDGENGLLVPPGDAAALGVAMARLVADDALRTRLGAAARPAVATYTAPAVSERFENLYEAAITAAGGA
jgi:glycosyltransferase involved in cell wall biosynthesis